MEDGSWVLEVYYQLPYLPFLFNLKSNFVIPTKEESIFNKVDSSLYFVSFRMIYYIFFFCLETKETKIQDWKLRLKF